MNPGCEQESPEPRLYGYDQETFLIRVTCSLGTPSGVTYNDEHLNPMKGSR